MKKLKENLLKKKEELEEMCALDYLKILNEETKDRLIGLCLDRKLLSLDGETEYEEGEESDDSAIDEMDDTSFINN